MYQSRSYFPLMAGMLLCSIFACSKEFSQANKEAGNQQQSQKQVPPTVQVNYRQEMRTFIQEISAWARKQKPGFIVVAQNSSEILTASGNSKDPAVAAYVQAIDGMGREELLYGYNNHDDAPTPAATKNEWLGFCKLGAANHLAVMTTDYCTTPAKIADSYQTNAGYGFISFAATHRQLDNIPAGTPYHENVSNINTLADAKNFLYLINNGSGDTQFINNLRATNYDVLVIDAFSENGTSTWTQAVINSLKTKKNGGKRLVLAYMSIGQAEQYRWYWKNEWKKNPPAWLEKLDPYWDGNYYVRYWMSDWKNIIFGNADSYTQKLVNAGFDGTYLDPVDGSAYWEEL